MSKSSTTSLCAKVDSSWVLAPMDIKPKGVVQFLGGAFVGATTLTFTCLA